MQLEALQAALTEYDKREYVTGYEAVPELDASAMDLSEKALAEWFIERIKDELEVKKDQKKCFSSCHIFFQAFHHEIQKHHHTPERILKVLRMLQEQKIVVSWFDNHEDEVTQDYIIYF